MKIWFNYAGSKIVKASKWIAGISSAVAGIYGIVSQFYTIPYESAIITAGGCISAVALFIVGKAKPLKNTNNKA